MSLLVTTLQAAVPLWQMRLQDQDWPYFLGRLAEAQEVLFKSSEALLGFGGKKGEAADAFNAVAEAIAILSFCPGGIDIFGQHWEGKLEVEKGHVE